MKKLMVNCHCRMMSMEGSSLCWRADEINQELGDVVCFTNPLSALDSPHLMGERHFRMGRGREARLADGSCRQRLKCGLRETAGTPVARTVLWWFFLPFFLCAVMLRSPVAAVIPPPFSLFHPHIGSPAAIPARAPPIHWQWPANGP